jgi:hypothetical protein
LRNAAGLDFCVINTRPFPNTLIIRIYNDSIKREPHSQTRHKQHRACQYFLKVRYFIKKRRHIIPIALLYSKQR